MAELVLAVLFDRLFGEPRNALHPVVWLGRVIAWFKRRTPSHRPVLGGAWGVLTVVSAVAPSIIGPIAIARLTRRMPWPLQLALTAALLKPAFAWRSLDEHVSRVIDDLENSDLEAARHSLAMIVSRPTATLDEPRVIASAIESLAENTSDSIVAPLFWYALGGTTAAWVYRAINTVDAMIGYRTVELEWVGKAGARLDDVANLLPARITAMLFLAAGAVHNGRHALQSGIMIWLHDASATPSPNSGHPMAAIAGTLGVELEKPGHYVLGRGNRLPSLTDARQAIKHAQTVALISIVLSGAVRSVLLHWYDDAHSRRRQGSTQRQAPSPWH
ncbi:MAG: cobalamin biosynthesis protein CobD [Chloroflexi bacterium]|nr:cobalamin biosynthesis protein CobD [Chloroflexota bacterium]